MDGTIDSTGQTDLGDAAEASVGRFALQLVGTGFTGTVTIKGKAKDAPASAYVAIAYVDFADGTTKTAGLTGDSLVLVDASGLDVQLDASVSAGSVAWYATPLVG